MKTLPPSARSLATRYAEALAVGQDAVATALGKAFAVAYPELELCVKTFDPDQPRDESGKWATATGAMREAHPFPQGGPEFAVRHLRAYAANAIHRMLNEGPDNPVPPPEKVPENKRPAAARKAISRVQEARADVYTLDATHDQVVSAHPEGKEALEAAQQEARRRYDDALENAKKHVESLPPEIKAKAEKQLYKATLEGDEEWEARTFGGRAKAFTAISTEPPGVGWTYEGAGTWTLAGPEKGG